jgi:hypothetical protein
MSIDDILYKDIERRQFLKGTGKAALGLAGLLSGCAPTLKELREDVAKINWLCNRAFPMPSVGCYVGTNMERGYYRSLESIVGGFLAGGYRSAESIAEGFKKEYGIYPALFGAAGKYNTFNALFPRSSCEEIIRAGSIPILYYSISPFEGYRPIARGQFDDDIKRFGNQVAEFGQPIIIIPFPQTNDTPTGTSWGGNPANEFKDAYVRIHGLCKKEGANKNAIWGLKLKIGRWQSFSYTDPITFIPAQEYVDILGWSVNDHNKPEIGMYSQSLETMVGPYYDEAATKFPRTPQFYFELSAAKGPMQHIWMDKGLTVTENRFPRVKGIILDEIPGKGGSRYGVFDPAPTEKTLQVIRKHFANPYFIGSIPK